MFEVAKGAYMSVYKPDQKKISAGHFNMTVLKITY